MRCLTRRSLMVAGVGLAAPLIVGRARAAELPQPAGPVILTVSGRITTFNEGQEARFDRPMLENLGMTSLRTQTPWYEGPVTFEGVLMAKLMDVLGASGTKLLAYALNDYVSEIPIEDFKRYGTLLALKRDGAYMPVRDKGPLFIVYPYDTDQELRSQRFYGRSAWQVAKMVIQ